MIRFHFVEHLARWRSTYLAIKQDAAENGRYEPAVYGNVHIIENAYSVVVSQFLDVVWTETPAEFPYVGKPTWGGVNNGFSALLYKLGRAAGNFSKPHWGIQTLTGCGLAPASNPRQTMTGILGGAEGLANGGVGGTVQLKLVSGSNKEDLATADAPTKHKVVFPYNDGDEVVLTATNTGKIVVHSLECADHGEEGEARGVSE